jgi:hypothetical protein
MTRPYFSSDVMSFADERAEISAMRNGHGTMTISGFRTPTRLTKDRTALCQWIRLYNCLLLSSLALTYDDTASNSDNQKGDAASANARRRTAEKGCWKFFCDAVTLVLHPCKYQYLNLVSSTKIKAVTKWDLLIG